jgi:succinate dehydrogenase/fumarate reductase flavoprotein subunit
LGESFDVIVAGFGFAGAAAAVSAADAGATVLLLEKAEQPGGISVCSAGGVRIARDADAALAYLRVTNGETAPEESLRALADGMASIAPFVQALADAAGAKTATNWVSANYPFEGGDAFGYISIQDVPGFDPTRDFPWVRGLRGGARLFKVMWDNVERRPGITVRFGNAAERLVTENGRIVGVTYRDSSGAHREARATGGVVLATGGFEAADEMKVQYWQEKPVLSGAYGGNTGDGIRMAQAVGADLWHMWHYHGTYGFRHPDPESYPYGIRLHRLPDWVPAPGGGEGEVHSFFAGYVDQRMPWILVDRTGRRFMNEYPPYLQDTGHRPMAVYDPSTQRYPAIPAWLIVDEDGRRFAPLGFPTRNDPGRDFAWSDDNLAELELGILQRADSVAEMAAAMKVDVAVMQESLERWNAACAAGADLDFGRLRGTMMPVEKPPFLFGRVWPIVANTQGGPVHDTLQRVLDPFGEPIPGLYAAGELGSVFGHLYMSGGNLAECFIGGRIAGRVAARVASAAARDS